MGNLDNALINGNAFSWSSVEFKIGKKGRVNGFKAISYKDSRERSPVYGSGRHHAPRGMTAGKYAVDPVTVTVEKETAAQIRAALAEEAADGVSFGNVEVTIVVQYTEGTGREITDTLKGCTWRETTSKAEEGPDALYEEIAFNCTRILWNGKTLYDGTT